jgi:hypothetical protein
VAGSNRTDLIHFIPLPAMSRLLDEMDAKFGQERERLLPTRSAWATLRRVCAALHIPNKNHHAFRHVFSTYCIAQKVPVPIIAEWAGIRVANTAHLRCCSSR